MEQASRCRRRHRATLMGDALPGDAPRRFPIRLISGKLHRRSTYTQQPGPDLTGATSPTDGWCAATDPPHWCWDLKPRRSAALWWVERWILIKVGCAATISKCRFFRSHDWQLFLTDHFLCCSSRWGPTEGTWTKRSSRTSSRWCHSSSRSWWV
jgi:hypothetical protein